MKIRRHARVAVPTKKEIYMQFGMHPLQGVNQKNDKFGQPVNSLKFMSELDIARLGDAAFRDDYRAKLFERMKEEQAQAEELKKSSPDESSDKTTSTEDI